MRPVQHETSSQSSTAEFLAARTLVGRAQFGKPWPTTLVIATMLFLFLSWCLAHLVTRPCVLLGGIITISTACGENPMERRIALVRCSRAWLQRRLTFRRTHGLEGWSPTLGAHMAVLAFMLTYGVFCLQHAIYGRVFGRKVYGVQIVRHGHRPRRPLGHGRGAPNVHAYLVRRVIREQRATCLLGDSDWQIDSFSGDLHYFERDGGTADERFDEDDPRRHRGWRPWCSSESGCFPSGRFAGRSVLLPSQLAAEAAGMVAKDSVELGVRTNALISAVFGPRRSIAEPALLAGSRCRSVHETADDQPGRISMAFAPRLSAGSIGQPAGFRRPCSTHVNWLGRPNEPDVDGPAQRHGSEGGPLPFSLQGVG